MKHTQLNQWKGKSQMRKFALFAIILAGFAEWIVATAPARVAAPTNNTRMDVLQMMTTVAVNLPTEQFIDYSFVYE
jgi:hypothetical protein